MKHLALLLALGSMTAFAGAQTQQSPYSGSQKTHQLTGWIGDAKCGASMHTAACVKKCVDAGEKPVFVDSKNKEVWTIDNADAVADYYGAKVHVVATVEQNSKSIHIENVSKAGGM